MQRHPGCRPSQLSPSRLVLCLAKDAAAEIDSPYPVCIRLGTVALIAIWSSFGPLAEIQIFVLNEALYAFESNSQSGMI